MSRLGELGFDGNWAELGAQCDAGRDLNAAAEFCFGGSPLYWAAANDAPADLVRRMVVAHGADLGWVTEYGWTAMHEAADCGRTNLVRLLAELGAPIDAQSTAVYRTFVGIPAGSTALHVADRKGKPDVTTALLEGGADAALRDADGKTAREVAEAPATKGRRDSDESFAAKVADKAQKAQLLREMLREFTLRCAARQRLALAVGMSDAAHALLGALPYDLLRRVCEEAQGAVTLLGRTELRLQRAPIVAAAEREWAAAAARECGLADVALRPGTRLRVPPYGDGTYVRWEQKWFGANVHFVRFDGAEVEQPVFLRSLGPAAWSVLPGIGALDAPLL